MGRIVEDATRTSFTAHNPGRSKVEPNLGSLRRGSDLPGKDWAVGVAAESSELDAEGAISDLADDPSNEVETPGLALLHLTVQPFDYVVNRKRRGSKLLALVPPSD